MPINKFNSTYRNQVFGTFNKSGDCQGSVEYCNNPNKQFLDSSVSYMVGCNCEPRCMSCNSNKLTENQVNQKIINTNKKIQNVVGGSESQYISNLSSLVVDNDSRCRFGTNGCNKPLFGAGTWNQSSDRIFPSRSNLPYTFNNVPSRGNSTKTSITRARPGSLRPGGKGVDVKHNSYARYLARIKANNLKVKSVSKTAFNNINNKLNIERKVVNNKPMPFMMINQFKFNKNSLTANACDC